MCSKQNSLLSRHVPVDDHHQDHTLIILLFFRKAGECLMLLLKSYRIIERLGLERILRSSSSKPPEVGRNASH